MAKKIPRPEGLEIYKEDLLAILSYINDKEKAKQVQIALQYWREAYGWVWIEELVSAWSDGNYNRKGVNFEKYTREQVGEDLSWALQYFRNRGGVSWLTKLRLDRCPR